MKLCILVLCFFVLIVYGYQPQIRSSNTSISEPFSGAFAKEPFKQTLPKNGTLRRVTSFKRRVKTTRSIPVKVSTTATTTTIPTPTPTTTFMTEEPTTTTMETLTEVEPETTKMTTVETSTTSRPNATIRMEFSHLIGQAFNVEKKSPFEMVVLLAGVMNMKLRRKCTGTLISEEYVLTAASCCCNNPYTLYAFSPKCTDLLTCFNVLVDRKFAHPGFFPSSNHHGIYCNNVALLKLSRPWPEKITFARLPHLRAMMDLAQAYRLCYAISYDGILFESFFNKINYTDPGMSNLTEISLRLVPVDRVCSHMGNCESMECTHRYRYTYTQFTSTDGGFCKADIGSPLFCAVENTFVQFGIRSRTYGLKQGRFALNTYMRTDHFTQWINFTINNTHT